MHFLSIISSCKSFLQHQQIDLISYIVDFFGFANWITYFQFFGGLFWGKKSCFVTFSPVFESKLIIPLKSKQCSKKCQIIWSPRVLKLSMECVLFTHCQYLLASWKEDDEAHRSKRHSIEMNKYRCLPHCALVDALMNCFVATLFN